MGLHHGLLAVYLSLAENQSIGQGGATTGDVDGATTGIIERWQVIEPAAGVPGPAGDGAVDDCGPPEAEEQRWDDTTALEGSTDHDHDRADAEEELVEAEDNLGEIAATWGRCRGDVLETEVCEISDEGTSRSRIGEGITPEHPLEGDDLDESLSEKQLGGGSVWTGVRILTPMTANPWYNMASADLRRAKPAYSRARPGIIIQTR